MEILGEIICRPKLDLSEIEKERPVLLEELLELRQGGGAISRQNFDELLWPNESLGRPIGGSLESLGNLPLEAVSKWWRTEFANSPIVISLAGSVQIEEVEELVRRFWQFETSEKANKINQKEGSNLIFERKKGLHTKQERRISIEQKDGDLVSVVLGGRAPGLNEVNVAAAQLLAVILGDGLSSRLYQRLREKEGMGYDVLAFYTPFSNLGEFGAGVTLETKMVLPALKAFREEFNLIVRKGVEGAELERAKIAKSRAFSFGLEDTLIVASEVAFQTAFFGIESSLLETIEKWQRVVKEQVQIIGEQLATELYLSLVGGIDPNMEGKLLEFL